MSFIAFLCVKAEGKIKKNQQIRLFLVLFPSMLFNRTDPAYLTKPELLNLLSEQVPHIRGWALENRQGNVYKTKIMKIKD